MGRVDILVYGLGAMGCAAPAHPTRQRVGAVVDGATVPIDRLRPGRPE